MSKLYIFFLFPTLVYAFTLQPWYPPFAECQARLSSQIRFYPKFDQTPKLNQSKESESHTIRDILVHFNGGMQFWPNWECQIEADFFKANTSNLEVERLGVQMRALVLNDVIGDPISLSLGIQGYYVPTKVLRKVSFPYHAQGNIEMGICVGKEVIHIDSLMCRWFSFLGIGVANRGLPWVRPSVSFQWNIGNKGQLGLFSEGYMGCGRCHKIRVDRFNGYGTIAHRSIDCGLHYIHRVSVWGGIRFQYTHRIYAISCPSRVRVFQVEYRFPFSLF